MFTYQRRRRHAFYELINEISSVEMTDVLHLLFFGIKRSYFSGLELVNNITAYIPKKNKGHKLYEDFREMSKGYKNNIERNTYE